LRAVLIIPDRPLPTAQARAALPAHVAHGDAAFNLGRLALLIAGLADRTQLIPEAFADRLHQDARSILFPEAAALLDGLREAGALGVCWSGAGPSLLALTTATDAPSLSEAATMLLDEHSVAGMVRSVGVDVEGVRRWADAPD
jgi:homoserine kinase